MKSSCTERVLDGVPLRRQAVGANPGVTIIAHHRQLVGRLVALEKAVGSGSKVIVNLAAADFVTGALAHLESEQADSCDNASDHEWQAVVLERLRDDFRHAGQEAHSALVEALWEWFTEHVIQCHGGRWVEA